MRYTWREFEGKTLEPGLIFGILISGLALVALVFLVASLIVSFRNEQDLEKNWKLVAQFNELHYNFDKSQWDYPRITGNYRDYRLILEVIKKDGLYQPSFDTHIVLERKEDPVLNPAMPEEVSVGMFSMTHSKPIMGKIYGSPDGRQVSYKQYGVETDVAQLGLLFTVLARTADFYPYVLAAGGRAVSLLEEKAKLAIVKGDNTLRPITVQALQEIEKDTTARLAHQASN
jgi:DNA-directed RNA polymerase subunit K/omega